MYVGYAPDGSAILAKFWPRTPESNDRDLEEIWRHELRQLHRLAAFPGAADCIAHLYDAGSDEYGFYLILSAGQRQPLQSLIAKEPAGHWLHHPTLPANRERIWKNLILLARGLEALHTQGLLHRSIDSWSVLTAGTEEPDFQLTGFEWSMRVVGEDARPISVHHVRRPYSQDSFLLDWRAYGLLAADILGAKRNRLEDTKIPPHEVAEHLGAEEAMLLRSLIQVLPTVPLTGEIITSRIDRIVRSLAAQAARRSPKFQLALRLGRDSRLSERIRLVSQNEIEIDDTDTQLAFVQDDLNDDPMLIAVKPRRDADGLRLLLRGKHLLYSLKEFRPERSGAATWEFAYFEGTETHAPAAPHIIGTSLLDGSDVQLLTLRAAHQEFPRARGRLRSWEEWKRYFLAEVTPQSPQQVAHKALSLIQLLEALYATANTFPVELVTPQASNPPATRDECVLRVRTRPDRERDNLARILGLKPPAVRLTELLTGDGVKPEGWILSESKSLGDKTPSDTEWRFQEVDRQAGCPDCFVFTGPLSAPLVRDPYLASEDSVGTDAQFRRRLKALRALKDHDELLRMIADPRFRIIESHDTLTADEAFSKLDDSKQNALRDLISTLPLYLVQGPPGVGKTRLVRDLVRRRFLDEPTSRLLLSAQSNAAIDHLMDELEAVLTVSAAEEAPLIVRCGGKDSQEAPSKFDIAIQSRQLILNLADSALMDTLPPHLRKAITVLANDPSVQPPTDNNVSPSDTQTISGRSAPHALRAFEGAVARAANVVFATTNSSELERLIEERAQCDWAIIEEAAKATGTELISPMLLSHRRLMIGDHRQLPPFASEQLIALLESPDAVRQAMLIGDEFVGRTLRDVTTDEILDEAEEDDETPNEDFPHLCAEALRLLTFFETTIEAEFIRQKRANKGRPIAKELTEQHRMHPVIAALVSRCFYHGKLTSHTECVQRFEVERRPFFSNDISRLPTTPIVVIDMPYAQATLGNEHGDYLPRWHNPQEIDAVRYVLSAATRSPDTLRPPTLAILSPYSQQVRRLHDQIRDLPSLQQFSPPDHAGHFFHTVDSFQGGEADLVIVSLVRNNGHANVRSALGFLSDSRRMNVLLSRARWQLVLVMSVGFLTEIVDAARGTASETAISFLSEMLEELRESEGRGTTSVVPFRQLQGGAK